MVKLSRKIQLLFGLVVCLIALLVLKKKNDAATCFSYGNNWKRTERPELK
jgi:hypothetical protein